MGKMCTLRYGNTTTLNTSTHKLTRSHKLKME